jgi:tetratricopeptide (TPR) repeat protein
MQFPEKEWPQLLAAVQHHVRDEFINPINVSLPERLVLAETPSHEVPAAEAAMRLGELMQDNGPERIEDAAAYLAEATERDSTLARAWGDAGRSADAGGDSSRAERYYERATQLAPDEPRVALTVALGTFERWRRYGEHSNFDAAELAPIARLARDRITRCLQLDARNPEALAGFGTCSLVLGEMPDPAFDALARAHAALPGRSDVTVAFQAAREMHAH